MRKKYLIPLLAALFVSACNSGEKGAQALLRRAEAAYEAGLYQKSIALIDSLKKSYPKAFDSRRQGQELVRKATLADQIENLQFLDSVLNEKHTLLAQVKKEYLFEKDTAYQQLGLYYHPSQQLEKNLHRSHLSFRVNERGELVMTSIYCGKQSIHHYGVRVTAPDATYMETPSAKETYESSIMGEQIEKSDFRIGEDGGVMEFIYHHAGENLKVQFQGEKSYTTTMSASDRQALVAVYDLAQLLDFIYQMEQEREACYVKIRFIKNQLEGEKGQIKGREAQIEDKAPQREE